MSGAPRVPHTPSILCPPVLVRDLRTSDEAEFRHCVLDRMRVVENRFPRVGHEEIPPANQDSVERVHPGSQKDMSQPTVPGALFQDAGFSCISRDSIRTWTLYHSCKELAKSWKIIQEP
ncbi:MAG: hypothetical protein O3C49_05835 [Proteobacteria bacterium]|nr:hypothetical protein [Pseudomonadota bacterium]MDA1326323.1 hypothetical protein [Pseudomonadota bacterium]